MPRETPLNVTKKRISGWGFESTQEFTRKSRCCWRRDMACVCAFLYLPLPSPDTGGEEAVDLSSEHALSLRETEDLGHESTECEAKKAGNRLKHRRIPEFCMLYPGCLRLQTMSFAECLLTRFPVSGPHICLALLSAPHPSITPARNMAMTQKMTLNSFFLFLTKKERVCVCQSKGETRSQVS